MINKIVHLVVSNFGFTCVNDFMSSTIHNKLLIITLPLAAISSIVETLFGLHNFTIISFVVLVTMELLTGLLASKVKGIEIESHKFGRFGLKILVWLSLLYIANSLKLEYIEVKNNFSVLASGLFTWLHGTLFIYITMEYFISVLENMAIITGKKNKTLIKLITDKLISFLNNNDGKNKK